MGFRILPKLSLALLTAVGFSFAADTLSPRVVDFGQERLRVLGRLQRRGNVDVDPSPNGLAFCHIMGYLAFSRAADTECNLKQAAKIYRELAAIYMAIDHFNNGVGVVVQELHNIHERCPIRFTAELVDSKYTPSVFVQSLTSTMESRQGQQTHEEPIPCAVVGARTSSATGPGAVVSGVFGLPQMSFTATSPELNDPFRYPLFSRVVTSDDAAAKAGLRFLKQVQDTSHVAVLYVNDPFGIEYNKAFLEEALRQHITVQSFPLEFPPNEENLRLAIAKVKQTGYRHIYLIIFSSYIESLMLQAQQEGLTGPEYAYLLGISTSFFEDAEYSPEQAAAFEGMAILPEFGATPRATGVDGGTYGRFLQAWNQLGPDDVAYFNTKLPEIAGRNGTECYQAEADFFTNTNFDSTGDTAPFAYDTIVAMGLGACAAYQDSSDQSLIGKAHASAIVDSEFAGVTGYIQMERETRARDPLSFSYAILNVRAQPDAEMGTVKFVTPESYLIRPNEEKSDWLVEKTGDFFYNDGSETPPSALPEIDVDFNWIGRWRILGYVLCGIVLWASMGLAGWSWQNRQSRAVRLSQPPFLIMITTGTFIMGCMLVPLGMDDEKFSDDATDKACMAQPWLASLGFVTSFAALYSKTSRIYKIMQNAAHFKTVKVSEKDVLVPFFILFAANVCVLLCWTLLNPLRYVRTFDEGTDAFNRAVSTTGRCVSEGEAGAIPYLAALAVINLGAVILANIQAYRARDISDDLSESKYIGLIMVCLLQTWLTGLPVLFLVHEHPVSHYVVVSLITFWTCMSILSLIFIPKILLWKEWKAGTVNRSSRHALQNSAKFGDSVLRGSKVSGMPNNSPSQWSEKHNDAAPRSVGRSSSLPSIEESGLEEMSSEMMFPDAIEKQHDTFRDSGSPSVLDIPEQAPDCNGSSAGNEV